MPVDEVRSMPFAHPDSGNPLYSAVFRCDPLSKNISRPDNGSKFAMKTPAPPPSDTYFLPYQRAWIEDKSPLKIIEKSRQVASPYLSS